MSAPARYATAPTPGAHHELAAIEKMARALGTPLMPWQAQVARVASERNTAGNGWRYPIVIVSIPRQGGKTTLMRAIMAQRTLRYPGTQAFYTAQSGKDARERWTDLIEIAGQKFPHLVKIRRGAGAECMQWLNGGGQIRCFAPTRTALHGYTPELVMLDEAFAHDEALGESLMAAIVPAQSTLTERQLWIVSTAGDLSSTWFKAWVERGRASIDDPASGIAYFEWSAPPSLDLSSPDAFAKFHPAVGYTQNGETLAAAREPMSEAEFNRAFGNRWLETRSQLISSEIIDATTNTEQAPPDAGVRVVLAYDVANDRSCAALYAAWIDEAGKAHVRPYQTRAGIWWLIDAVKDAAARGFDTIAADDGGATSTITRRLQLDGFEITTLTAGEFAQATGDFIEALTAARVDHPGNPGLLEGLQGAALRRLGEREAFSRRESPALICEVIAAAVAHRLATHSLALPAPLVVA